MMLKLTTIIATISLVVTDNEPQCYSRFDYEYKVVQKLVELENSQRQQLEIYKVLQTEFENFKSQLAAVESANKNLRADFSKVKDRNNYLDTELQNIKNRSRQTEDHMVAFSACLNRTLANIQGNQIIVFDNVLLNEGGGYNQTSGIFTCPMDGVYLLTFFIGVRHKGQFVARLMVNNIPTVDAQADVREQYEEEQGGNSAVIKLARHDKVWVQQLSGNKLESWMNGLKTSSFSVALL